MRRLLLFYLAVAFSICMMGQKHSAYYYQRVSFFETLPGSTDDIIFIGNSITNGCEWTELFENQSIKNRGINGDIAEGVYDRLPSTLMSKPKKVFLMIGVNDIARGTKPDSVIHVIDKIIDTVRIQSPKTHLYVQSSLPVNNHYSLFVGHMDKGDLIIEYNNKLRDLCTRKKTDFIDLYASFKNKNDEKMNLKYTNDGLHLMAEGYLLWKNLVLPYIND